MLPNRFPDGDAPPEYNAVDASLWYIVAVHEFLARTAAAGRPLAPGVATALASSCAAILEGYAAGTRFGIALDAADGLLRAGTPGMQLTWMDAKVGDRVVTPRIGKPVEVQALWINALRIAAQRGWDGRGWDGLAAQAHAAFAARFANPVGGLHDVVDLDHVPGAADPRLRPNQILSVGGLPFPLLEGAAARGRFLPPLLAHLDTAGLGHVSEVADGNPPHAPGGCPFQAWSLAELLRVQAMLDADAG